MGLDFLDKTAKRFERACQQGFENLSSATLFDPFVAPTLRSFIARLVTDGVVQQGSEVVLRVRGDQIVLFHDEREIAVSERVPATVIDEVGKAGRGLAVGRIDRVHPLSRSVDVTVL